MSGRAVHARLVVLAAALGSCLRAAEARAGAPDFAAEVLPVLRAHCFECHGADRQKGGVRLDVRARVLERVRGEPPVVVPGDPGASRLLALVDAADPGDRMPPDDRPALPPEARALLRRWIEAGAPWPDRLAGQDATRWAYRAPRPPPRPAVARAAWPRVELDRFVLARLEREGLAPSPPAAPEALLRRVTLDLTGLPPTLAEIDAFAAEAARRPDAYERAVDRLLASPRFGEHMARHWLDLARYADTNGFEKDRRRALWKYRDWVIDAFNGDLPFDRFTVDQLAGDLVARPTAAQRVATGFHRNTMLNEEGGVDPEEARWEVLVDRVNTTAQVWLATTLACAQCHDHKHDPFSQRDYYRLLAIFEGTGAAGAKIDGAPAPADAPLDLLGEPRLELPSPAQARRRAELGAALRRAQEELRRATPERAQARRAWEEALRAAPGAYRTAEILDVAGAGRAEPLPDGSVRAEGPPARHTVYTVRVRLPAAGGPWTALRLEALPDPRLPGGGPGRDHYGNFNLTGLTVAVPGAPSPLRLREARADDQIPGWGPGHLVAGVPAHDPRGLPLGWAVDATRDEARLPRQAVFVLDRPLEGARLLEVTLRHEGDLGQQALGRIRLSVTAARDPLLVVGVPAKLRPALKAAARTPAQQRALDEHFVAAVPLLQPQRDAVAALERRIAALGIPSTLVMHERRPRSALTTEVRVRGDFTRRGERVAAGTPAALHPLPGPEPPDRLAFARWLVRPDNPLTARVTVNRLWHQLFGRGLVETSEDFGTHGARPDHPELLDHLALELQARGWRIKAFLRMVVTSATYRQDARLTPALAARDPDNRLLARGPRFRLDAEAIRDVALAAAGLLSPKIGGPSVFPPQPAGIWDLPNNSDADDRWVESAGEDRHRRGLYTFWRRTSPYPSFVTFDAPSREQSVSRRPRTNTPLQALTTLNDPAFFEAAVALGRRARREGGTTDEARVAYAFRLCTGRRPTGSERARMLAALARLRAAHAGGAGEDAAWAALANALLNLDETITKG